MREKKPTFLWVPLFDVPERTSHDSTETRGGGGGPKTFLLLANVKFKSSSFVCCRRFKVQEHLPAIQKKPCSELCNSCTVMF